MGKRLFATILAVFTAIAASFTANGVEINAPDDVKDVIGSAVSYKCADMGCESVSELLDALSKNAGNFSSVWYFIALSQLGEKCENDKCVNALKSTVNNFYNEGLEKQKVTDLQRVAFALSAFGVDITDIDGHNLLADASYNRKAVNQLDSQGANSASYGLLLLDSKSYKLPKNALNTRGEIIDMILDKELENGGFALFGEYADIDITTIALQALAPYKNNDRVEPVVERCVNILSKRQSKSGAYKSFSNQISCESTAQVILALTSLGIDPSSDERFIKEGNSVLDGLLRFRLESGAFSHFENGKADNMATYQSLCALVSVYRFMKGEKSFYDFSEKPEPETVEVNTEPASEFLETEAEKNDNNSVSENKIIETTTHNPTEPSVISTEKSEKTQKPTIKKSKIKHKKNEPATVASSTAAIVSTQKISENESVAPLKYNSNKENKPNAQYISVVVLAIGYIAVVMRKR